MRSTISKALFLFLSVFFSLQVFAANIYCDYTNGNDANDCTNGTTELCQTLQRCVNVATGGDTINIANTSAQVLTGEISWSSGWTADNTKYTIFQSWNNGGSITIQRPDEASARVAATINVNSAANKPFSTSSHPSRIIFKNLKITGATIWLMYLDGAGSAMYGCEVYGTTGFIGLAVASSGGTVANGYFHGITSSGGNATMNSNDAFIYNNYFESNSPDSGYPVILNNGSFRSAIYGNIINVPSGEEGIRASAQNVSLHNNTIIAATGSSSKGINIQSSVIEGTIYNNVFYNFDGSGDLPLTFDASSSTQILGYNAFYDCNAYSLPSKLGIDLTANDVTGTGDPFVDSANDDYTLDPTTGAAAIGAGLGNPNSSIDIGAVQSAAGGGGGSSEHSYSWVN